MMPSLFVKVVGAKGKHENKLFKSYLNETVQSCSINGQKFDKTDIICEIPQGSCLGPLLFIVYFNDFEG